MPRQKNDINRLTELATIQHENVTWSNDLISSPISCSLLERRVMYFITGVVKHKYVENGLNVPENWKELYFYMTDRDLGIIGGQKNIRYTYDVLTKLGMKFFPITYHRPNGSVIVGRIHWVDTFFYDEEKDIYAIRISPEIMPLLINLTQNFTTFDLGTAMRLRSKYTQKLYELCCKYGGDYRFSDGQEETTGNVYKKRVVPIAMEYFRVLFNLNEIRDKKTGRVLQESSYESYKDIRSNILQVAQNELYDLFMFHASNVWFDYQAGPRKGKGGKTSSIIIYVYTRENPKEGLCRPWQKGDEELWPYEPEYVEKKRKTPQQKLHANIFYGADRQEEIVISLLSKYLSRRELTYYMGIINKEARLCYDSYTQVIQVILEKEKQPKFKKGTKQYKRNNIIEYALQENLKEYGWSIEPPKNYKQVYKQQELFPR
jgi:hypothetical protein